MSAMDNLLPVNLLLPPYIPRISTFSNLKEHPLIDRDIPTLSRIGINSEKNSLEFSSRKPDRRRVVN